MKKAYTYEDIAKAKFKMIALQGEWLRHLGRMQRSGSILIMGDSGHGKTSYALQLMKALCQIEKVFYNSVEEGLKASFKRNLDLNGLKSVSFLLIAYNIVLEANEKRIITKCWSNAQIHYL